MANNAYSKNLRCSCCGGVRSDTSRVWCINCIYKYANTDHTHLNQCYSKTSEWQIDIDGCMVRWHGDINIAESEVCVS